MIENKEKQKEKKKGCWEGRFPFLSNERRRRSILFTREASDTTYLPTYCCWRRELNLFFPIARKKADAILLVPPGEDLTLYYLPSIPSASPQPAGTYLPTGTYEIYVPGDNMTKVHTPSVRPSVPFSRRSLR